MGEDQLELRQSAPTPEEIDSEIAEGMSNEKGAFGFLNNFETRLPGGFFETRYDPNDPIPVDQSEITIGHFLTDRDRALDVAGINLDELQKLRDVYKISTGAAKMAAINAYLSYAAAVYRELRLMGYSHEELTYYGRA